MKFYFHEYVETEFDRAVEYYEDCRYGLGIDFAQEVYATIDRIIQYPDSWVARVRAYFHGPFRKKHIGIATPA